MCRGLLFIYFILFFFFLQGISSSAPIVPTKVLGDPEELEKHLAMLQNGFPVGPYAAAAAAASVDGIPHPGGGFDDRFIFTPPTLELAGSDVLLHPVRSFPIRQPEFSFIVEKVPQGNIKSLFIIIIIIIIIIIRLETYVDITYVTYVT